MPDQPTRPKDSTQVMRTRASLRRAIDRLVAAELSDSWKGAELPESHEAIEEELTRAKASLDRNLARHESALAYQTRSRLGESE